MAQRLYSQFAVLLAKVETTEGVDATPTPYANAMLVSKLSINPLDGTSQELPYVRAYMGANPQIRVEDFVTMQFTCDLAGSGIAGVAPAFGVALRGCGLSETVSASTLTGTITAPTSTTVTLDASASSVANTYVGATIFVGGFYGVITAYSAAKVATVFGMAGTPTTGATYTIVNVPANADVLGATNTTTTVTLGTSASATDGAYAGATITVGGVSRVITGYVGTTKVATVGVAFGTAPSTGAVYSIQSAPINYGTAASATTTTVTLAAGASAVDNAYTGMDLTIGGYTRTIIGYVGATKVATVNKVFGTTSSPVSPTGIYTVNACAQYLPISTAFESVTLYYNVNGTRHKATNCRGTFTMDMNSNGAPAINFSFTGVYNPVVDAVDSQVNYAQFVQPVPVNSSNSEMLVNGYVSDGSSTGVQIDKFSIDLGGQVKHRMLIGAENVIFSDRNAKGSIEMEMTKVAFNDWFSQIKTSVKAPILFKHGNASGNGVNVFLPNAQLAVPKYNDSDGIVMLGADVLALPLTGNDEIRFTFK